MTHMSIARERSRMRLVVATDGSIAGTAALRLAVRMASRDPATTLTVITIAIDGDNPFYELGDSHESEDANPRRVRKTLRSAERMLARHGLAGDLRVVAPLPGEAIPDAIAREAERLRADLIMVGSEGRDTLREWVVGGVALRLIYVARRPVVVVRPPQRRRSRAA